MFAFYKSIYLKIIPPDNNRSNIIFIYKFLYNVFIFWPAINYKFIKIFITRNNFFKEIWLSREYYLLKKFSFLAN